jgi:L-fucose isomerase-like protein
MNHPFLVRPLTFDGASETFLSERFSNFQDSFPGFDFRREDVRPEVLLFLSGGSEQNAIRNMDPSAFYLLIAPMENNAFAAAAETSAWMRSRNIRHSLQAWSKENRDKLSIWLDSFQVYKQRQGKRIGILGKPSPWLVASMPSEESVWDFFRSEIISLNWEDQPDWKVLPPSGKFLDFWKLSPNKPTHVNAARVYQSLVNMIEEHRLDALSVECFPIAREDHTTACLALALLNQEGFTASCEGDIVSTLGMLLGRMICGKAVWMANLTGAEGHSLFFSHCTLAPELASDFTLDSHFETGCSLAVKGELHPGRYTAFRLNNALDQDFVLEGRQAVGAAFPNACRSQCRLVADAGEEEVANYLEHPLGNHHILLPGSYEQYLRAFFHIAGVKAYQLG